MSEIAKHPGVQGLAQLGRNALDRISELEQKLASKCLCEFTGSGNERKINKRCTFHNEAWRRAEAAEQRSQQYMSEVCAVVEKNEALLSQLAEAETLIDTLRMQAAACMTATFQNTHASKKNRIDCCHPYWTQAYDDVCAAVDREITERERAEAAERQLAEAQNTLSASLFQLDQARNDGSESQ